MTPIKSDIHNRLYKAMLGVGGIGVGKFFLLDGDHTLGREESRSGQFLDTRDYCKLHIISHYVKVLLGPDFAVIPIGKVGDDDVGATLLREMEQVGMSLDYVACDKDSPTLFSFCFVYPDGSGGNMTTNDSACARVDAAFVEKARPAFKRFAGKGVALAAPEAPLAARVKLLAMATENRFFRVASFTSEEMRSVASSDVLQKVDLLAVNLDEAATVAGMSVEDHDPISIVEATIRTVREINADIMISITHGKEGSWCWDGVDMQYVPAHNVEVKSTAGAGDAHLAGIIVGLTVGLTLPEAQQLGALTAAHAVTSPHTINDKTNRQTLLALAGSARKSSSDKIMKLLENES